jgi:hypothetical protein
MNSDAGSRVAQPGVSASPMRHSLEKAVKDSQVQGSPLEEWSSVLFKKLKNIQSRTE